MTPQARGCLVQFADHVGVDGAARLEGAVEFDLADFAAQGGLRELRDREAVVGDPVGGQMRIEHLHVEHRVDADLDVVARDADLLRDVDGDFLQAVPVGHPLDERNEDVEARLQGAAVFAQILDDERALLRHHGRGLGHHDDHHDRDGDGSIAQGNFQEASPFRSVTPCTTSVSPSTRCDARPRAGSDHRSARR